MQLKDFEYKCINAFEFCKEQPDNSINLIITSPPYNIEKSYKKKTDIKQYIYSYIPILEHFHRILKNNGSICWQIGNFVEKGEVFPLDILFYPLFKELGFVLRNRIIWHFGHGLHCKNRFSGRYETILWFTKSNEYIFNLDNVRIPSKYPNKKYYKGTHKGELSCNLKGKNPEDLWELTINKLYDDWDNQIWEIPYVKNNHPEKENHPCQFPVELAEKCVLVLSNDDDIVYDPFAGVGSTLIASLKNNRVAYGTKLEQKYIDIGLSRIKRLENNELKTRPIYQNIYQQNPQKKRKPKDDNNSKDHKQLTFNF